LIVDHLESNPANEGLAYFYCDRNDEARRKPENILNSLVKQLSFSRDGSSILRYVVDAYEKKEKAGFASEKLRYEEAEMMLPPLIQSYAQTTIILDGVDECQRDARNVLMSTFDKLVGESSSKLRVLLSSRRDDDIQWQLRNRSNIAVEATDNCDDIATFVRQRLDEDDKIRRIPLSNNVRDQIIEVILKKSAGM
jgi:ankyrin repeat domain-containing protein 50